MKKSKLKNDKVDCSEFLLWLLDKVLDEEDWDLNSGAYGELICRRLKELGLLEVKDGYYTTLYYNLYEHDDENINTSLNLKVNPELRVKFLKRQYELVLEENKKLKAKLSNNLNHENTWIEQNSKNITQFTYFGEYKCPYCDKISFSPYDYCPNCGRKVGKKIIDKEK